MPTNYDQQLDEDLSYTLLLNADPSLNDIFQAIVDEEISPDVNMYSDESNSENCSPHLRIIVEPVDKFRYRYKSEKGFHGGIHGDTTVRSKRSCPVVQLENFTPERSVPIVVKVSLFMDEPNPRPHVLDLIGKKCANGVSFAELTKDRKASFPSIAIGHKKREEVKDELMKKEVSKYKSKRQKFDEKQIEANIKEFIKNINLKSAKLGFQAFYEDDLNNPLCDMVFSQAISDSRGVSSGDMNIIRISSCTGRCTGGEEIILLCDKIKKDDIQVRFYEKEGDFIGCGIFSQADVHHQVAITFKTPSYEKKFENIVQICLYQPSDEKSGPPRDFRYIVDENGTSRKRRRGTSMDMPIDDSIQTCKSLQASNLSQDEDFSLGEEFNIMFPGGFGIPDLNEQLSFDIDQKLLPSEDSFFEPFEISNDDSTCSSKVHYSNDRSTTLEMVHTSTGSYLDFPDIASAGKPVLNFLKSAADKVQQAVTYNTTVGCSGLKTDAIVGQMAGTGRAISLSDSLKHSTSTEKVESKVVDHTHRPFKSVSKENPIMKYVRVEEEVPEEEEAERRRGSGGLFVNPFVILSTLSENFADNVAQAYHSYNSPATDTLKTDAPVGEMAGIGQTLFPSDLSKRSASIEKVESKVVHHTCRPFKDIPKEDVIGRNISGLESFSKLSVKWDNVAQTEMEQATPLCRKERANPARNHKLETIRENICDLLKIKVEKTKKYDIPSLLCAKDKNGNNSLHLAVLKENQNVDLLINLLDVAQGSVINHRNKFKETPLHLAVQQNHSLYTSLLLDSGADFKAVNQTGDNCFHLAAKNNFFQCMDLLFRFLNLKKQLNQSKHINALNYDGLSPLHLSIMNNSPQCMQLLLIHKADVNLSEKKCGRSSLHLAIEFQPTFICNLLLQPDLDLDAVDFRGYTPLQTACDLKRLSFEKVSKQVGEDANSKAQFLKNLDNENVLQRWKLSEEERKETDNSTSDDSESDEDENEMYYDCNDPFKSDVNKDIDKRRKLSGEHESVEQKLCKLLDNSDWRKLGEVIGLTKVEMDRIAELNAGLSPTRTVLKQIKEVYSGQNLKTVLIEVLGIAGLTDAVQLVQDNG